MNNRMELYLLRHAEAVPHGDAAFDRDSDRPLTADGEKRMRRVAAGMRQLDLAADPILSSPFVRARQTAEIAAQALTAMDKLTLTDSLAADGDPAGLIAEIQRHYRSAKSILLVGHEPYLSGLISQLLTGHDTLSLNFRKAALAKLTVTSLHYGRCAALDWFLTPRQLERIAGK